MVIFENFELHAEPTVTSARCRKCRNDLVEVPNGFLSRAWFCPACEFVYMLKLVKAPASTIDDAFMAQCRAVVEARAQRSARLRQ